MTEKTFRNGFVATEVPWGLYIKQKKNQVYKLLPLKEEEGEWENQLTTIEKELGGLNHLLEEQDAILIQIIAKLGLLYDEEDFLIYRKTIFEILSLLEEL